MSEHSGKLFDIYVKNLVFIVEGDINYNIKIGKLGMYIILPILVSKS